MFKGKEPISYKWASWGQWSSCTKTCGGKGTVQRTRKCISPKWGGNECPSNTQTQTKDCDTDPCPGLVISKMKKKLCFYNQKIEVT